jgi:hypothetical protein
MMVAEGIDVVPLNLELQRQPHLWGQVKLRETMKPHEDMKDIWVRYNDMKNYTGDLNDFNDEHFPIWYPAFYSLPALRPLIFAMMTRVQGEHLGAVLITRIPPGQSVGAHVDEGWHANFYNTKLYLPIRSNEHCVNRCENEFVTMRAGECWTFNNLVEHDVVNDGEEERITLIVCIRAHEFATAQAIADPAAA